MIAKTEEEAAYLLMGQIRRHTPEEPPALTTDGKGAYRDAMLFEWGNVPEYCGHGRPPILPQPGKDWKYLQVVKIRHGSKLVAILPKVIYGDPNSVPNELGEHTAYVERTHLTSRQMNGRLVRKTLSFSKEVRFLEAASADFRRSLQFYSSSQDITRRIRNTYKTSSLETKNPSHGSWSD